MRKTVLLRLDHLRKVFVSCDFIRYDQHIETTAQIQVGTGRKVLRVTKKKVWRYYCEFCKKGGLAAYWIKKHEAGCTANPSRVCGLCAYAKLTQRPMAELLACISTQKTNGGLEDLRNLTENCPACMLAAIRQSGVCKWDRDPENPPYIIEFDFKAEMKDWWQTENEQRAEEDYLCNRG